MLRSAALSLLLWLPPALAAGRDDCDPADGPLDPSCAEARGPSVFDEERVRYVAYGEGFAYALAGTAKARSSRKQRNKHSPGEMDEIVTEKLPGVEIAWLRPSSSKRGVRLLYSLSISRRGAHVPLFRLGVTTEAEIEGLLGPPASIAKNALRYDVPNQAGSDVLVFHLRKGKLSRVYWEWFLD